MRLRPAVQVFHADEYNGCSAACRIYVGDMDNDYLDNAVYLVERIERSAPPGADLTSWRYWCTARAERGPT